jgi:hypothetical protein
MKPTMTTREAFETKAIKHGIKELAPAGSELPTNSADQAEVTSQGQIPAWHDAPTCAGLWFCDEGDENPYRFTCHNVSIPLNPHLVGEGERWYGPIPPDGDKP